MGVRALSVASVLAVAALATTAGAQDAFALPWTDQPARVAGEHLVAAAVAQPDDRIGRFSARRASARRRGRAAALRRLHAFVDDALARVRATPREAAAAHAAVDASAEVQGTRPLVDAGAVVVVRVPRAALRDACPREALPW